MSKPSLLGFALAEKREWLLFVTHYLDEADEADQIYIVDHEVIAQIQHR